jgi:Uma2 family endonuclease
VPGKIVEINVPYPIHGLVCGRAFRILDSFAEKHDLGRVLSNDSGIVTGRNPDSVRGADVAFYSFTRLPRGRMPRGYLSVSPEVVFEVRSESERWSNLLAKSSEYLDAGVAVVCLLDPKDETIHVVRADEPPMKLETNDELILAELHESFRVPVRHFFE